MGTIYRISGSNNVLVSNTRETLVYPFDFGSWKELRIGGFFSLTTSGTFSGLRNTSPDEVTSPELPYTGLNQLSWGIINEGDNRPSTVGSFFAGVHFGTGLPTGSNIVQRVRTTLSGCDLSIWPTQTSYSSNLNGNAYPLIITSGEQTLFKNDYINERPVMVFPGATGTYSTGLSLRANFNGIKYVYSPTTNNLSVSLFGDGFGQQTVSNPSLENLLSKMDACENQTASPLTGYCSETFLPSSLFLMLPFLNNRIRTHSLLVKKYS